MLALISVILLFSVSVSALTWDGSSAGGSTSAVNGSNSGYVIRSTIDDHCVVGYRFSVVDRTGGMKVNKVIDVYRNTTNGDHAYSSSAKFSKKYNKKQLIEHKNDTLNTTENTTNCYKEKDMGFVSKLPNPDGVGTWQKYETNINKVLTKIGVGSVDNMVYGDKVVIEPLFDVCLAGEYQALTVTEIAYCGRSVLGGSSDGGKTLGNSSTWGFISNYTNRIWPNKLYTPDGQDLWPGVSAIAGSSKATFNTILTKGYGVGIAYSETLRITYTIAFKGNGATSGSTASMSMVYGKAKNLTANGFKRTGYTFTGWNRKSDGSGTKYNDKASVKDLTSKLDATVNLYAQWKPIKYTVHFNGNGSSSGTMSDLSMTYDTAKALTANAFKKTGYTFDSWHKKADGSGTEYANKASVKNLSSTSGATVNLYAQWNPVKYYVEFHGNGSTSGSMSNETFKYDSAKALTANSFKRSFTVTYNYNGSGKDNTTAAANASFSGWAKTADGAKKYDNKESVKNLTSTSGATVDLYAKWSDASVKLPSPTRAGYVFSGWYTAASGGTKIGNGGASYTPSKNITLYARWNPITYTIKFNGNGSTSGSMSNLSMTYDVAKALTANAFKKTGYSFVSWNTKSDGSGTKYTNKQSVKNLSATNGATINLYAQWSPITYYVKFNGNGSTSGSMSDEALKYDTAKALTANAFKREFTVTYNYNGNGNDNTTTAAKATFSGWAESSGGAKKYDNKESVKNLTSTSGATVDLYAKWTNASVTLPSPTRTGYVFSGWYTAASGGTKIGNGGASYTPAKNITLYAQWTPITYTIKFNGNGSTSGSMANQSLTYDKAQALTANAFKREFTVTYNYNYYGSSLTSVTAKAAFSGWASSSTGAVVYTDKQSVKNLSSTSGAVVNVYAKWTDKSVTLPTPTRTGYTFDGWYTDTTGGTKVGTGGGSYTPSKSLTLYAHWTPITYTVKFNGNGSTSGSMSNMSMTYDTAKTLTANSFKKTGYSFTGWNTKADGSGTSYSDRQSVKNLTSTNGAVINLYAQWTPITYKIHFIGNGATSGTMSDMTMTYDTAKALTANAFVNGSYDFLGWNTKTDGSGTAYTDKQSVKNLTAVSGTVINLYAQWDDGTKLFLEAVMPNASYRENTDVVTSFNIINKGADGCVPNDSVSVVFKVYRNSTVIKTITQNNIVVPGNGKNLLFFKWTVPDGITAEKLYISAEIHESGRTYGMVKNEYATCKYIVYSTPDTQYAASAPSGFTVPAVPAETSETAKWSVWVYEDGAFRKVNYGIKISGSAPVITPDASANASQSGGTWVMKSGYGYGISLNNGVNTISGYTAAPSSAYTDPQYALDLFPEFGYAGSANNCRTLELVSGKWSFRQNGEYGRIHFTPLWYPDGPYTAGVLQSDCWTPAGMIQRKTNTNTITISGSAYDDWYIG